jgi:2-desacetyl-2-hydroxyethyl bacteriochlorophyllide A dehydrogenase
MRAAVLQEPYALALDEVEPPQPAAGQVRLRIRATAICGTDVGIYTGKTPVRYPRVLGHESTGVVDLLGEEVTGLAVGDRVVLNSIEFCRHCPLCFAGRVNLCPDGGLMGREVDGTFADYVVVPDFNAIRIPDSISFEDGTSLIALATVFRAHDKVSIGPEKTAAVIGQGAAGLLHTRISVLRGAERVFAVEPVGWKLELAERYGAIPVNPAKVDPVTTVREATEGQGADLVIECVGKASTLRAAMQMVRPGGTVLCFGILPDELNDFYGYAMYYKELTLVGSRGMTPNDFVPAIRVVEDGRLDLQPLITHRFPLERTKEALDLVHKEPGEALRVVVSVSV